MEAVRRVAGAEAVDAVAATLGGRLVYIPKDRLRATHPLAVALGLDMARAVIKVFAPAGENVNVPLGPANAQVQRARRIRELILQNKSTNEVARECNVTRRTVQNHVAFLRAQGLLGPEPRHPSIAPRRRRQEWA